MRRRNNYKFTKKKQSKRGMLSCFLAAASIFALIYLLFESFLQNGNGSVYLGSAGVLALAVALIAFVQSIKSLREEDTFRYFPVISFVLSFLAIGAWGALYTAGFLL